jgi:tetratricopeptide (TPR) repeat protein
MVTLVVVASFALSLLGHAYADKVPVSTKSEEARELYVEARDLFEKLRFTDARDLYLQALERDGDFALAHLGVANTSTTANEFFESIDRAAALVEGVSEGERLMILGTDAAARSNPARQGELYTQLVEVHPDDERARALLGNYFFGIQDYGRAIEQYEQGIAVNSDYAPIYNMLGYAYRFTENFEGAEKAFKKYVQLIPGEPNPYDSYAEFLMKRGRFEESIVNYEKALEINKNFVASYVGIALNQVLLGKGDEARETLARLASVGRNVAEKRQALQWIALSHVFEGNHDAAVKAAGELFELAKADNDGPTMSGDKIFMGNILLDSGNADEALARFNEGVEIIEKADVLEEVKKATRRNHLFFEARALLRKGDLKTAKSKAHAYMKRTRANKVPFEVRQAHELAAMVALEEEDYDFALGLLREASQQNPRVLYLTALAHQGNGDEEAARGFFQRAADFNGLNFNYAYVRDDAQRMIGR